MVESSGPPCVITNGSSKNCIRPMLVTTVANSSVGRNNGTVTYRNRCHPVAPSTDAASYSSFGMACRPASRMIISRPMPRHVVISMIEGNAHDGSVEPSRPVDADLAEQPVDEPAVGAEQEPPHDGDRHDARDVRQVEADAEHVAQTHDALVEGHRDQQAEPDRQRRR